MEGYLLVFAKERTAQIQYCVLDCGLIKCFDAPDGNATGSIALTRHRVQIKPLAGGSVCPNRFVLRTTEVKRQDEVGKLAASLHREQSHIFAAPTSGKMCRWVNAIHNWRRHTFDDPLGGTYSASAAEQTCRRTALELERMSTVDIASRFDICILRCRTNVSATKDTTEHNTRAAAAASSTPTKFPKIRPISAISEAAARKVLFMQPSRASGVLVSMLRSSFLSSSSTVKREVS